MAIPPKPHRALPLAIACTQLADIFIHAATNQIEPLRVTANAIILVWIIAYSIGGKARQLTIISVLLYLGLNTIFLMRAGITNPAQGDELRLALFILIGLTTLLSIPLITPAPKAA